MKKVIRFSVLFMFLGTIFSFQSCNKESQNNQPVNSTFQAIKRSGNPAHRRVYNDNYDCKPPAENCLDDVIIRPQRFDEIKSAAGNGSVAVKNYFLDQNNIDLLNDVVSDDILTKLQSGTYGIIVKDYSNDINPHAILLAGPISSLSENNFEFAFSLLIK
ncbi:MAG: hypothetical protein JST52_01155 [Bacteroidetes bacterium]|nr:hypothetical protein [Bacteroidota bacterium]MBS1739193.1 hypothetical protein [Bacteroidota bacterium]